MNAPEEDLQSRVQNQTQGAVHVQIRQIPPRMHARYHASGRTYVYRILYPSSIHSVSVFEFNRCWAYEGQLSCEAMAEAAAQLLGTHDFSTFRATGECAVLSLPLVS